jgi:hypothetical protein
MSVQGAFDGGGFELKRPRPDVERRYLFAGAPVFEVLVLYFDRICSPLAHIFDSF